MDATNSTQSALEKLAAGGEAVVAVDMDALLNQDLASIPDLPDYVNPKEGAYLFSVDEVDLNAEIGQEKKRAIQITYNVDQLLELKGTLAGDDVKAGNKFTELYFLTTEKGAAYTLGLLKKLLAPVSARTGAPNLRETLLAYKGFKVVVQIKHQKDRDDKEKVYAKIVKLVVPE